MLTHKLIVTGKSLIAYIVILFLWPTFTSLFRSSQIRDGLPIHEYFTYFFWFILYGVPLILVIGFPVTFIAGVITKKLHGFVRVFVNFSIHILSAYLFATLLFREIDEFLTSLTIMIAAFFFLFDEWRNASLKKYKVQLMLMPFIILCITMFSTWTNDYQIEHEKKRLDSEGFLSPIVLLNQDEVDIVDLATSYSSGGINENNARDPYILPKGMLGDDTYDVWEGEEGDKILIDFERVPSGDYTLEVSYMLNDRVETDVIRNNEFIVPEGLEPQAILINAVWERINISFNLYIR
ncbi:hypothetical protein [Evansella halocellulosilytica]|uniref:hypothetical protein n=1 Tax=Evansella halocellulosilytica TaxID=2011013 RepID=UPI000BB7C913|nr:hypothetical protein [Evansella halocellulosilytica]